MCTHTFRASKLKIFFWFYVINVTTVGKNRQLNEKDSLRLVLTEFTMAYQKTMNQGVDNYRTDPVLNA